MPDAELPNDSDASARAEPDAYNSKIEISTEHCRVLLEFPGATAEGAYWLWKRVAEREAELRESARIPSGPALQANATGFVIEQADEWRNDTLPGGVAG